MNKRKFMQSLPQNIGTFGIETVEENSVEYTVQRKIAEKRKSYVSYTLYLTKPYGVLYRKWKKIDGSGGFQQIDMKGYTFETIEKGYLFITNEMQKYEEKYKLVNLLNEESGS